MAILPIMEQEDRSLELSPEKMRDLVESALERLISFLETLPDEPAHVEGGAAELARSVVESLPVSGENFEDLLRLLFERLIPHSYNTAGPGYMAYIPGGGLPHSAVADLIANTINRYVGVWIAAPGLAELESNVVRWFCEIVGYPPQAFGFLTTGGSLATFSAVVTARSTRLPQNFLKGTLYASDQTHHSVMKAARLAGFPPENIRIVESGPDFTIRLDHLQERIEKDRTRGWIPFLLSASAGTTNTGAVDPLLQMAAIARRERLWLHTDAAYGGFFMLTRKGRKAMVGIEQSDSIVLDPHKGLFLPYGTGCLLVRQPALLQQAHSTTADYMPVLQKDGEFYDFCELSPELSRDFRGLRVWLPLKMHGIGPFRRNLEEKLELTAWVLSRLRDIRGIEIVAEPQLSTLAFRMNPGGLSEPQLTELNRRFLKSINAPARIFLTPTTLKDRFVIRVCVLSFRTHLERVQMAVDDIASAAASLNQ